MQTEQACPVTNPNTNQLATHVPACLNQLVAFDKCHCLQAGSQASSSASGSGSDSNSASDSDSSCDSQPAAAEQSLQAVQSDGDALAEGEKAASGVQRLNCVRVQGLTDRQK